MPRIITNEDGTRTFTVNSSELHVVRTFVDRRVPDVKKVLDTVDGRRFRATLDFVRSVVG